MFVYFAQEAEASGISSIYLFLILGLAFYFLIIRPQRRRANQQRELVQSLEIGDAVRTVGGIRGTIESLSDETAVIRVVEGSIEVERRAVAARDEPTEDEE